MDRNLTDKAQMGKRTEPLYVKEGEMKTYTVGIVAVAILLVVTGVGFGIAQAGGNHTDRPVLSFEDQEALEYGSSSSPDAENRPVLSFDDQELIQVAKSPTEDFDPFSRSEDMHLESPIETGAIPVTSSEESWMKEYGHD
jgi:hypothetical protein